MKKTSLFVLLVMICANLQAQFTKGTVMLGGTIGASKNSSDYDEGSMKNSTSSSFSIEPSIGFFISDKTAIGIAPEFGKMTDSYEYDTYTNDHTSNSIWIGLFCKRYFSIGEKASFFINGNVSYGITKNRNESDGSLNKSTSENISISLTPGINYFVSEKWAIEARFGSMYYSNSWSDSENSSPYIFNPSGHSNGFGLALGISSFSLGLRYFIKK